MDCRETGLRAYSPERERGADPCKVNRLLKGGLYLAFNGEEPLYPVL